MSNSLKMVFLLWYHLKSLFCKANSSICKLKKFACNLHSIPLRKIFCILIHLINKSWNRLQLLLCPLLTRIMTSSSVQTLVWRIWLLLLCWSTSLMFSVRIQILLFQTRLFAWVFTKKPCLKTTRFTMNHKKSGLRLVIAKLYIDLKKTWSCAYAAQSKIEFTDWWPITPEFQLILLSSSRKMVTFTTCLWSFSLPYSVSQVLASWSNKTNLTTKASKMMYSR